MNTLIRVQVYNESSKKWLTENDLGKYLTARYNDQNTRIEFYLNDVIQIDRGLTGFGDDLIYEIKRKTHYFQKKNYLLILYLKVHQD